MNKLEDNIYQAIGLSANNQGIINQALATNKVMEITTDVAVKFLTFVENNYYYNSNVWYNRDTDEHIKKSELFEIFIKNYVLL